MTAVTVDSGPARPRCSCENLTVGGDGGKERNKCSAMSKKTGMLIRSLEVSLAHWCTITAARCCTTVISAGHQ